jgi:hypothetical protein
LRRRLGNPRETHASDVVPERRECRSCLIRTATSPRRGQSRLAPSQPRARSLMGARQVSFKSARPHAALPIEGIGSNPVRGSDVRSFTARGAARRPHPRPALSRRPSVPRGVLRRVARKRLGITPDEIDGGYTPALSRPEELADRLEAYRVAVAHHTRCSIVRRRWSGVGGAPSAASLLADRLERYRLDIAGTVSREDGP